MPCGEDEADDCWGVLMQGRAKCFDAVPPFFTALENGEISAGMVLIFRYQGPKGAPGMPEVRFLHPLRGDTRL